MKIKSSILSACFLFTISSNTFADDVLNRTALDNAVVWVKQQQNLDGSWGTDGNLRYVATTSAVHALESANQYTAEYYAGLAWIENQSATNVDSLSRKVSALYTRGNNIQSDLASLQLEKVLPSQEGWGLSARYSSSPLDTAIVLTALIESGETAGQIGAINYLVNSQNVDGGWSLFGATTSKYWVSTAIYVTLELIATPSAAVTTAISNATAYIESIPAMSSDLAISQAIRGLYLNQGYSLNVDTLVTELLSRQMVGGNWGNEYETTVAIQTLAAVLGLDTDAYAMRTTFNDQTLRSIINGQLGKNAFDNLTQGELLEIVILDLRGSDVLELVGLENATNLTNILVNSDTDLSAIAGLTGVTVLIDSDSDDVADSLDNCPFDYNPVPQPDLDNDGLGNVCDDDIDGDGFTVAQGDTDDYDPNVYPGSIVTDGDVNGNGAINAGDLVLMQRHVMGITTLDGDSITRGDLYPAGSGDDVLNVQDLLLLQKLILNN